MKKTRRSGMDDGTAKRVIENGITATKPATIYSNRRTMKPLRMTIPPRLRPHLIRLLKGGLNGATERQVALRLIEEKLRELKQR